MDSEHFSKSFIYFYFFLSISTINPLCSCLLFFHATLNNFSLNILIYMLIKTTYFKIPGLLYMSQDLLGNQRAKSDYLCSSEMMRKLCCDSWRLFQ